MMRPHECEFYVCCLEEGTNSQTKSSFQLSLKSGCSKAHTFLVLERTLIMQENKANIIWASVYMKTSLISVFPSQ